MQTQPQVKSETAPEPVALAEAGERFITGKLADKLHKWIIFLASIYIGYLVFQAAQYWGWVR